MEDGCLLVSYLLPLQFTDSFLSSSSSTVPFWCSLAWCLQSCDCPSYSSAVSRAVIIPPYLLGLLFSCKLSKCCLCFFSFVWLSVYSLLIRAQALTQVGESHFFLTLISGYSTPSWPSLWVFGVVMCYPATLGCFLGFSLFPQEPSFSSLLDHPVLGPVSCHFSPTPFVSFTLGEAHLLRSCLSVWDAKLLTTLDV